MTTVKQLLTTLTTVILTCVILLGIAIYELPPYAWILSLLINPQTISMDSANRFSDMDVASLIRIKSKADGLAVRSNLNRYIWGQPTLDDTLLPAVTTEQYPQFDALKTNVDSLDSIRTLTTLSEFGISNVSYHFLNKRPDSDTVIFVQGHGARTALNLSLVSEFLNNGLSVVLVSMPLTGPNSTPAINHPVYGELILQRHQHLAYVVPTAGHPIRYFLDGLLAITNYLHDANNTSLHLAGISGGGWTTTLYSALDNRITSTLPIAGSYPLFARLDAGRKLWGDFEQLDPGLYEIANYFELYLLGSLEQGRQQVQLYNLNDPCCFSGDYYTVYESTIKEALLSLEGGTFDVIVDRDNADHAVSQLHLDAIVSRLK